MSNISKLTKEKIEQCKKIFDLYDFKKEGFIETKKLNFIYKGLGAFIPNEDLQDFLSENKENKINFDVFLGFFADYYTKKIDKKQLIDGFTVLDKEKKGTIKASELKHSLMVIGDKLTESEANELLDKFIDQNGLIDYKKLAEEISK